MFTIKHESSYEWSRIRPDMHSDRRAWEVSWDTDFRRNFQFLKGFPGSFIELSSPLLVPTLERDLYGAKRLIVAQEKKICKLQQALAREVAADPGFVDRWKAASKKKRNAVVLEGIYRTMAGDEGMDGARHWAPETTVSQLCAEGGEAYLRVLKILTPQDPDEPMDEYLQLPNAIVDRMLTPTPREARDDGCKTAYRMFRERRALVLTVTIYNVFRAFNEQDAVKLPEDEPEKMFIPEPADGFVRSPALRHQISLLENAGKQDYFIQNVDAQTSQGIHIADSPADKLTFMIHRNRALRTSSVESVSIMLEVLSKYIERLSIPREQVVKQLEEEYGVQIPRGVVDRDVDTLKEIVMSAPSSSEEEMEAVFVELRRQVAMN